MEARRGAGRRRQRPQCGALPDGTERPCKQSQEGDAPGSRQGTEAPRLPHESSTVACATPAPGHSPVRAEGKPSPRAGAPGGCAPRRPCRAATASPGPPRPPASHRPRWEPARRPVPRPGCRPARPGPRTAAEQGPSTRRRPTEPDAAQPSSCSCRRGPPAPYPRPPACLSRRASWRLLATLGVSVAGAVSGCSENSAAMSRSTSSSRLRLGRTSVIVRLPVANVAVVITTSFCVVLLLDCARLRAKKKGRPRMETTPCVLGWV